MRIIPLESNPKIFNLFFDQMGFEGGEFHELFGFEPESISFVPRPHLAMIFCYPYQEKAFEYRKGIYGQLEASGGGTVPGWARFGKQSDGTSCGYFALLHAALNNKFIRLSSDGFLAQLMKMKFEQKDFENSLKSSSSLQEESSQLDFVEQMTNFFNEISLSESETTVTDKADYHFIVYIVHDGRLFEFDSLQKFPRDCGPSNEETLLVDAGNVCMELMEQLGGNISCNAIALSAKGN